MPIVSALATALLVTLSQVPKAEPPTSVVAIKAKTADGEVSRVGIVIAGQRVATTLGWMQDLTEVQIIAPDGTSHPSTGIVSYNLFSNAALLAVDWGNAAPPAAKLAKTVKPDTDELRIARPAPNAPAEIIEASTTWVRGAWVGIAPRKTAISVEWGGAPILDVSGTVLGIISGAQGTSTRAGQDVGRGVYASRAEILASLTEVPLITWKEWPAVLRKCTESEIIARESASLARRGELRDAKVKARESVELDPRNSFGWQMVAAVASHSDDDDEAIAACRKSMAINPCDTYPYAAMGGCLARTGRMDEARQMIDRAIELDPKDFRSHCMKGFVNETDARIDEALAAYREAVRLNPEDTYSKEAIDRLGGATDPAAPKTRPRPRF